MVLRALLWSAVVLVALHTVQAQVRPPKILLPERAVKYVDTDADSEVNILCKATGDPEPTYQWLFNKQPIDMNSNISKVNPLTGLLKIAKYTDRHEGDYQCIASNTVAGSLSRAVSDIYTLKSAKLKSVEDKTFQKIDAVTGSYVGLTCDQPPLSVPAPMYNWYLTEWNVLAASEVEMDENKYIDAKGTLHFLKVQEGDMKVGKNYTCSAYNSVMGLIKLGSDKKLTVTTPEVPDSEPAKLELVYHTDPAIFMRTKEAVLECVFRNNGPVTVTWMDKNKTPIPSNKPEKYEVTEGYSQKLIIKELEEEDIGLYYCGASDTRQSIYLDIISGPIWVQALSHQTVPEGKDAVFTCESRPINGDLTPINTPIWYKNGELMPYQITEKLEFSNEFKFLTVKKVDKRDIVCFQCNVSNAISYEFSEGCLNVIEPIVIVTEPELEQHITKGDVVILTVVGKTDPGYTLLYRWHFQNQTYEFGRNPPYVTFDQATMQAYINTSDLTEEEYRTINGTYYRELYHKFDSRTVAISVVLKELPVPVTVVAAGVDLWWIALIVALIILIIVIILIVVICNRKRQEGTYPLDKKERANDIDPEKDLADSGFHDLSRAPGDDDYPTKKSNINPNFEYGDDMDMGDDDESLMEYGGADFDTTKFNEDGSFIGQYSSKNKTPEVKQSPMPLNHHATESQI